MSKFMLHFTIHEEKRNSHSGADAKTDSLVASLCYPQPCHFRHRSHLDIGGRPSSRQGPFGQPWLLS